jgi:hypothetical protein
MIKQYLVNTNKGFGLVRKTYKLKKLFGMRYWKLIRTDFERRNVPINRHGNVFINLKL